MGSLMLLIWLLLQIAAARTDYRKLGKPRAFKLTNKDLQGRERNVKYRTSDFRPNYKSLPHSLATGSLRIAKSATKAYLDLLSPKFVRQGEILGSWRLEQKIIESPSGSEIEAVTIHLHRNGSILGKLNGVSFQNQYTFVSRSWPRSSTLSFKAPLYKDRFTGELSYLTYYGYFVRPILSKDKIILRGTVAKLRNNFL